VARGIRVQYRILSSLDDLIGEKLMTYAETTAARSSLRFVAGIRAICGGEEIRHDLDHLERMAPIEDTANDDDFFSDSPSSLPH
jgi:hypothetical protein